MKPLRSKPVVFLGLVLLALMLGCARKKVAKAPPPPAVPESTPSPQPQETPAPTQAQKPTQGTPPPSPDQGESATENGDKTKAKNGKPHPARKATQSATNGKSTEAVHATPPRTVVRPEAAEPTPTPGQISPSPAQGGPFDQAGTEQLLQNTETNLTGIKRQLSQDEDAMVSQIKDFVGQSRQAIKENDLTRAHNLALKAHLLCDDLIKRR